MKKHYTVSAAIIVENKKILCVQRNKGKYDYISYKYEFPGGKLEVGENEEDALKREISEELNLEIDVAENFLVVTHEYLDFNLTMHSYLCKSYGIPECVFYVFHLLRFFLFDFINSLACCICIK